MFGGELDAGGMTDPNGMFSFFSSATVPAGMRYNSDGILVPKDGFGPGTYQDDYSGLGDRVYWGPTDGSPPVLPPPVVLNANTEARNGVKLSGGVLVKSAKKAAAPIDPVASSGSSTGSTVLQPRSETSSAVIPGKTDLPSSGSMPRTEGSYSRGQITNSFISDSVGFGFDPTIT